MSAKSTEVMNIKVDAGSRTLYVDLKQEADRGRYLSISEVRSSNREQRSRILVDEAYIEELHRALTAVLVWLHHDPTPKLSHEQATEPAHKSYTLDDKRREHAHAYEPWTAEEQERLKTAYRQGRGIDDLARIHGRAPTAILSRLYQLGLIKPNEAPRWD